jgi:hypothetical protein
VADYTIGSQSGVISSGMGFDNQFEMGIMLSQMPTDVIRDQYQLIQYNAIRPT